LTLLAWVRQIEIMLSTARRAEGARERGRDAQAQHGEGLGHAFAQAGRGAG
jgi:hypothetical protein